MIDIIDGSDVKPCTNKKKWRYQKYTNEELLEYIRKFYEENGRIPRCIDFKKKNGYPSHYTVEKYFGSWNNAIKEAGFEVNRLTNLTNEELLEYLKRFEEEYGRYSTSADLNNLKDNPGYPSMEYYVTRFGGLENARKLVEQDIDSRVRKGIVKTKQEKARLAEIFVLEHFVEDGAIDLSGKYCMSEVDGICPKELKYDVKSSSFRDGYWRFYLNKGDKVDFYYLLAFSEDYSELNYVWRVTWDFLDSISLQIGLHDIMNMKKYEITEKFKDIFNKWKKSLNK